MGEKEKDTAGLIGTFLSPNYVFTQSVMLALKYGFELPLPTWVVWFPSYYYIAFLGVVLIVVIIVAIFSAILNR